MLFFKLHKTCKINVNKIVYVTNKTAKRGNAYLVSLTEMSSYLFKQGAASHCFQSVFAALHSCKVIEFFASVFAG